ncbi:MAG: asparagine synthetase A [Candidatus Bathyarchaeia archaeon]
MKPPFQKTPDTSALIKSLDGCEKKAIFTIETAALSRIVNRLVGQGFFWILPVMLAKSTDPLWPDAGASIEKRIEVEIYDETVRTMQSMIIHKRVLVSTCLEKFFILSPNIRIEKRDRASTGSHLYEFTQLDMEAAYWRMEDVFKLFEGVIRDVVEFVKGSFKDELKTLSRDLRVPQTPFKVCRREELEKEYGKDWEVKVSESVEDPVWVTNIPREFYDYEDEERGEWRNFDLFLPEGYGEVISGAEREHEYEKIVKKLERDGLRRGDYSVLLELARRGRLRPSSGAGIGVERFVSYLCGAEHVAEVQPFPRIPGVVPEL